MEAVKAGKSVYFGTLVELIDSLRKAEREGKLRERVKYLTRHALMIVDVCAVASNVELTSHSHTPCGIQAR